MVRFCFIYSLLFLLAACNSGQSGTGKPESDKGRPRHVNKPKANFQDTMAIQNPSAIFYYPDSLQLAKIKDSIDSNVYKGLMHSYFYQLRNAHIVIKKRWSELKIIDAKDVRYLKFYDRSGKFEWVDLDRKNDMYGLILSNLKKPPVEVDMTNLETQISFYLKE